MKMQAIKNKSYYLHCLGKALRFVSKNYPNYAMGVSGSWGKITNQTGIFQHFKLTRGLCGEADTVSFESIKSPGHFLRQDQNYWVQLNKEESSEAFKKDASFRPIQDAYHKVCVL